MTDQDTTQVKRRNKRIRGNGEGSIYKRDDGRYVAAVSIGVNGAGKPIRRTKVAKTPAEAKRALKVLLQNAEDGLAIGPNPTVGEFLQNWIRDTAPQNLRARTLNGYRTIVENQLIPAFGRIKLRDLKAVKVNAWIAQLQRQNTVSPRSVQYYRAVLRAAISEAQRLGYVKTNEAKLATVPSVKQRRVDPLTPEQARFLLENMVGDQDEALIRVAVATGLRQGELLGLRWRYVDLERRTLTVAASLQRYNGRYNFDEPKTDRSRRTITSLPGTVVEALRRHKARQNEERMQHRDLWNDEWDLVFCNAIGEPLNGSEVTRRFQSKLAALKLPRLRFHDLRHGCASILLEYGASMGQVMDILGHTSISTTMNVYAHLSTEMKADTMSRMEEALSG